MKEDIYLVGKNIGSQPFSISIAGYSYCDGTYRINRRDSSVFCMEYIMEGCGTVDFGGKSYYPKKDDVYMLMYGNDHYYYSDDVEPWTKVWFNASGPLIENIMRSYGMYDTVLLSKTNAYGYFERIINLCKSSQSPDLINHKASIVFHELIQYLYRITIDCSPDISTDAAVMRNHIDTHIAEDINISKLAELIYKSPSQALRIFKKEFGTTPYSYLLSQRLQQAESLLLNTNLLVKEIASRVGFTDEHYFSHIFRQKRGVTPMAYRLSAQK
jgi:AraC family transcriptional regulator of arabinose operon